MCIARGRAAAIRHFMAGISRAKRWLRSSEVKLFTKIGRSVVLVLAVLLPAASAQIPTGSRVLSHPKFRAAQDFVAKDHDRLVREIVQITEVEAPPFKEEKRAKLFAEMLRQSGLADVDIDAEGNVIGLRKGTGGGPLIAIAAHLDTVFPEGTNVKVRREGTRLFAPGIGDDARALAVLLAMVRAMDAHAQVGVLGAAYPRRMINWRNVARGGGSVDSAL